MGFKLVPLVAFGILGVGNLLHIIGLATPEWVTADVTVFFQSVETTRGLWEGCVDGICKSYDDDQKYDWLKACEALAFSRHTRRLFGRPSCWPHLHYEPDEQ